MDYILNITNDKVTINKIYKLDKILNTDYSTIAKYERGEKLILTAFAYQISKKFNLSIDSLCGKSKDKIFN